MKVYITKYALTQGIIERDDAERCKGNPTAICIPNQGGMAAYYHAREWWTRIDYAHDRVSEMLAAKIRSIEKSLDKLRKMEADPDWPKVVKCGDTST